MNTEKPKTFNSQVNSIVINRLKLKRREKAVFYRLLGFLIRNDKPFPYSTKAMSDITGYSRSSVFECLNLLENLKLIERVGFTSRIKFTKGYMLIIICTLVQNRIKRLQIKNNTLVQKLDEISSASPVSGYKKTSLSLKHKETGFSIEELQEQKWYLDNPGVRVKDIHLYLFEDIPNAYLSKKV